MDRNHVLRLGAYAVLYVALGGLATLWATPSAFSLWFPAAGLRFAYLWRYGPAKNMLPVALVETGILLLFGGAQMFTLRGSLMLTAAFAAPLVYGATIQAARRLAARDDSVFAVDALPMTLAAIAAPAMATPAAILLELLLDPLAEGRLRQAAQTGAIFVVGDLLGVLLVAPALLWLAQVHALRRRSHAFSARRLVEAVAVFFAGWLFTLMLYYGGLGLRLGPILLAITFVGLRNGRLVAWIGTLGAAAVALPLTARLPMDLSQAFSVHLTLSVIAVVGHLVGSYADAQTHLQGEVRRRDRLLLQAERLKTLRAMSTAVIHEIGQPLALVALEADHLAHMAACGGVRKSQLVSAAAVIRDKSEAIAELVRRLRDFGERTRGPESAVAVHQLVRETLQLARIDSRADATRFDCRVPTHLCVRGERVELQQALLNLVRNAIQRSSDGEVALDAWRDHRGMIQIRVCNGATPESSTSRGMGVGLIVTASIASAHGGELTVAQEAGRFSAQLQLPDAGDE